MTVIEARRGARMGAGRASPGCAGREPGRDALSVALPTLAVSLHASAAHLQWLSPPYTLALAVALLPGGLLGDRFGRKKMLISALTMFGLGSLACALLPERGRVHRRQDPHWAAAQAS